MTSSLRQPVPCHLDDVVYRGDQKVAHRIFFVIFKVRNSVIGVTKFNILITELYVRSCSKFYCNIDKNNEITLL